MPSPSNANPPAVNVLFTSSGRRVELLRAFRRAYRELNLSGRILAADVDPLAPTFREADATFLVPRVNSPAYIPAVAELVRREKVALVFPLIDPDIPALAAGRAALVSAGARVMTPGAEAVDIARDKWKTHLFFRERGIPAARSWLPEDADVRTAGFPLFIKPRAGSAGKGAFRIENVRELEFFLSYVPDPVIQECLPGPEITADVACSARGEVWSVCLRKRIEVRAGEVSKGVTVWDERIAEACVETARGLAAAGPITVQCLLRDGEPFFTEINARYGGGCPLGFAAGADSPIWYLAEAAGIPVEIPPLGSYKQNLAITRYDDSFFLDHSSKPSA